MRLIHNYPSSISLSFSVIFFIVLLSILTAQQWTLINGIGNNLSFADPWTEADTIRSAEGFATNGFSYNSGLPDIAFGQQFPDKGTKKFLKDSVRKQSWTEGTLQVRVDNYKVDHNSFVYTHYPPGPHWIAGVSAKIFGVNAIKFFRIFPILIGLLSITYFSWQIFNFIGATKGAIAVLLFTAIPMFLNMMHGLSYQGYAFALLLLEIGICLKIFTRKDLIFFDLLLLFLISHLQGWMSFDYFFLVSAIPALLLLLFPSHTIKFNQICLISLVCIAGFALAHTFHFYQVVHYFDSFDKALSDFFSTAAYRSQSITYDDGSTTPSMLSILWNYLTIYSGTYTHLGVPAIYYSLTGAIIIFMASPNNKYRLIFGIFLSLLIASAWVIVMPQHAAQHWHFIPRHYFICIFFTSIAVLNAFFENQIFKR
jgi:hypothetical protein